MPAVTVAAGQQVKLDGLVDFSLNILATILTGATFNVTVNLARGGTTIASVTDSAPIIAGLLTGAIVFDDVGITFVDAPGAGSFTYSLTVTVPAALAGLGTVTATFASLNGLVV
ncbi:hypothetical protein EDM56_18490 [Brevibacillus fluminis]|uniref:Uncharacterized protein n=1 Tax=Brevibacillus fluminis TaxID=511487 RepID=A0A3M8DDZ7_9BACL|nr:hypothetical protein EDM56_18490 [Brevibacillus fluminis]